MPRNEASDVPVAQASPLGEERRGGDLAASAPARFTDAAAQASVGPAVEAAEAGAAGKHQLLGLGSATESSESSEEDEGMALALSGGISGSTLELFSLVSSLRQQIDVQLLQLMKKNSSVRQPLDLALRHST